METLIFGNRILNCVRVYPEGNIHDEGRWRFVLSDKKTTYQVFAHPDGILRPAPPIAILGPFYKKDKNGGTCYLAYYENDVCDPNYDLVRISVETIYDNSWEDDFQKKRAEKAETAAASTIKEALSMWMRFDPPGMRPVTKAKIQRAVQLYQTPAMRSETKLAREFRVSRKQISKWFSQFHAATGFPVVLHRRHESVSDHLTPAYHKKGRKIVPETESI